MFIKNSKSGKIFKSNFLFESVLKLIIVIGYSTMQFVQKLGLHCKINDMSLAPLTYTRAMAVVIKQN